MPWVTISGAHIVTRRRTPDAPPPLDPCDRLGRAVHDRLDNLVVGIALPSIRTDLGGSIEALEWTVNAYTLAFAVLLMTGAALGDRFGRRRMFVIGLALFTGASAAAALAPSIGALVAARALQGVGAAIIIPLSLTILSEATPPGRRGLALGSAVVLAGGALAAPLVPGRTRAPLAPAAAGATA